MRVYAVIDGQTYALDDGALCWYEGDDGLGMAPAHRLSQRGPMQNGVSDVGYRLDPRAFRLVLSVDADSIDDMWRKREGLLDLFKPTEGALAIRFEFAYTPPPFTPEYYRQIDCFFAGDMSMPSSDRSGLGQKVAISLIAPDPTYYNPTPQAMSFGLGGGAGQFVVPTPVPTSIGASTIDMTQALGYVGSADSYPTIRVTGPLDDLIISNMATGDVLDFTGSALADGEWLDIDLRYGYKTVRDQAGANQIGLLTASSDLSTFRIATTPAAPSGINTIRVQGDNANVNSRVDINWYDRYIGI